MTIEELKNKSPREIALLAAKALGWNILNDTMFEDGESMYCTDPLEGDLRYWSPAVVADDAIHFAELICCPPSASETKWAWSSMQTNGYQIEFINDSEMSYVAEDDSFARALTIAALMVSVCADDASDAS